jgi:hypothetical protein
LSPPTTTAIVTASTDASQGGPVTLSFGETVNLTEGDVLTVVATQGLPISQEILPGSTFGAVVYQSAPTPVPVVPPSSTNGSAVFTAGAGFPALTAVVFTEIGSPPAGEVVPVDPTVVDFGATPTSPPVSYVDYPYIDGVSLAEATAGSSIQIAMGYGSIFQVAGAGFIPGGILYAGPGGLLTQDYNGTILPNCSWIIVVGRALDASTFVYEPHIPSRLVGNF